jgi:Na+/melibiose symporter-like transporter
MVGDWVMLVGLPLFIYKLTGSTLATGALLAVGTGPAILFGSIAGVFVDRWDRKRTMIFTNLIQALVLLPLLVVHSREQIWIVYAVLFVGSTLSQFFVPAEKALLPLLVEEKYLAPANSLSALNGNLARLLGPALGGLIVGLTGLIGVAIIDAVSFVLAAALIMFITRQRPLPARAAPPSASPPASVKRVSGEWREGLKFILHATSLTRLFAISTITMVGEGFFGTLMVPFVVNIVHGTESDYGYLMTCQAIGGIVGSILIARIAQRFPAHRLFGVCAILLGLLDLALFYYPLWIRGVGLGMLLIGLAGIPSAGFGIGLMTMLQALTTDAYRGRVFGVYGTLSALLLLVGAVLSGVLGEHINVVLLLTVQGAGFIVAGSLGLMLLQAASIGSKAGVGRERAGLPSVAAEPPP